MNRTAKRQNGQNFGTNVLNEMPCEGNEPWANTLACKHIHLLAPMFAPQPTLQKHNCDFVLRFPVLAGVRCSPVSKSPRVQMRCGQFAKLHTGQPARLRSDQRPLQNPKRAIMLEMRNSRSKRCGK